MEALKHLKISYTVSLRQDNAFSSLASYLLFKYEKGSPEDTLF